MIHRVILDYVILVGESCALGVMETVGMYEFQAHITIHSIRSRVRSTLQVNQLNGEWHERLFQDDYHYARTLTRIVHCGV